MAGKNDAALAAGMQAMAQAVQIGLMLVEMMSLGRTSRLSSKEDMILMVLRFG